MDSETTKERIADTIEALIPDCANRKAWLRTEALAMNMSFAMLKKYHDAKHECAAGAYLSMCKQWPSFHDRVRDTQSIARDPVGMARALLDELTARRNAVSMEGRGK